MQGKINNTKIANRPFENMEQFKYLETAVANQNVIHEEIKMKLDESLLPSTSEPFVFSSSV
jgi:hypothetical protein